MNTIFPDAYVIGFTGTQQGLNRFQRDFLESCLDYVKHNHRNVVSVHGDCIGGDETFGLLCFDMGFAVVVRPGCDFKGRSPKRARSPFHLEFPAEPYIQRNHKIVDSVDHMYACPFENEEQLRSGTWATIRYSKKVGRGLKTIYPNGQVEDFGVL